MALSTITVNIDLDHFTGTAPVSSKFRALMSGVDTQDGTVALPTEVTVDLSAGVGTIALWPNDNGPRGTHYTAYSHTYEVNSAGRTIERITKLGIFVAPASGPVDLGDLLVIDVPESTQADALAQAIAAASAAGVSADDASAAQVAAEAAQASAEAAATQAIEYGAPSVVLVSSGGALNDNADFTAALARAATLGIKTIIARGVIRLSDLTITSFAGDVDINGGTFEYVGTVFALKLDGGTGRMVFHGSTLDGGARASTERLFSTTNDAGLTLMFNGGGCVRMGDKATDTRIKGVLWMAYAAGGLRNGFKANDVHCPGNQAFIFGYGFAGALNCEFRRHSQNMIRLGLVDAAGPIKFGYSFAIGNKFEDADDYLTLNGQNGNFVSCYYIEGHRVTWNVGETAYASAVRENHCGPGVIACNRFSDTSLVGIFSEFGSYGTAITGNVLTGCGTAAITVANPSDLPAGADAYQNVVGNVCTRIGYMQTYSARALTASFAGAEGTAYFLPTTTIAAWAISTSYAVGAIADDTDGTFWHCLTAHTSASSGTFADDRTANPQNWLQFYAGRNRARGVQLSFGSATGNTVNDVNPCSTAESVAFSAATQNFGLETYFGQNVGRGACYLIGFGLSNSKTYRQDFEGISGNYLISPFAALGSGFAVFDAHTMVANGGDEVWVRNVQCPSSLLPSNLEPGSWLINPTTGKRVTYMSDTLVDAGTTTRNSAAQTLSLEYFNRTSRINSGSAVVLTIPANLADVQNGEVANVLVHGAGAVTIVAASGVTLTGVTAPSRYAYLQILRVDTNVWNVA